MGGDNRRGVGRRGVGAVLVALLGCSTSESHPETTRAAATIGPVEMAAMFSDVALAQAPDGPLAPCIIFDDLDGDRRPDLFLVPTIEEGRTARRALVYRNEGGAFSRHEVALGMLRYPQSCAAADYDGDGRLDVFLGGAGNGLMLRNRGGLTFEDVTAAVGVPEPGRTYTRVPAFIDYDRDGRPDLYLGRMGSGDGPFRCDVANGGEDYTCHRYNGATGGGPALLLHNVGGRFEVVDGAAGAINHAASLGVAVVDWNLDGWQDLVVANDFGANRVYLNRGGTFVDAAPGLGLDAYNHGMGVACADFAGTGGWDLYVADYGPNQLWVNNGGGAMLDQSWESNVGRATWTDSNWAPLAADFDQDGRVDLFVASSASMATREELQPGINGVLRTDAPQRDLFFFNRGPGPVFAVGQWPHAEGVGVGIEVAATAAADFDGDGDVDVAEVYGPWPRTVFRLIRNDVPAQGHWLQVGLEGAADGATVLLDAGGRRQRRSLTRSTGSLGGSSPVGHFGLGDTTQVDRLTVVWPSGQTQKLEGPLPVDRVMTIAPER